MNNRSLVMLLGLVLVVAGCTGAGAATVDANNGIVITDFTVNPTEAGEGDLVFFDLEYANHGGTTAKNIDVNLFGIQNQWFLAPGSLATLSDIQGVISLSELNPPIPERDIPGDIDLLQWQFHTPEIPQGITYDLPITARVEYDYQTSGFIVFNAISDGEFQRRRINKEPTELPPDIENSAGPLHITVDERFRQPIIVNTDPTSGSTETRPLHIEIHNVGKGFPLEGPGAGGVLTGQLSVRGPGVAFGICGDNKRTNLRNGGTVANISFGHLITRIREDGKAPIVCTIEIDKNPWAGRDLDTIQLAFEIQYKYFVEDKKTVTVFARD